jgi:hypothetical protein
MVAADAAPALSEAAVARAQLEMSRIMAPGETVAAALKRMQGGGDAGPKKGARARWQGSGARGPRLLSPPGPASHHTTCRKGCNPSLVTAPRKGAPQHPSLLTLAPRTTLLAPIPLSPTPFNPVALPPPAMGKREKARLAKLEAERAAKAAKGGTPARAGAPDAAGFQRLTELADTLVSAGELDVYGATAEQLARWAALTLPRAEVEGANAGGAPGGGGGGAGAQRAGGRARGRASGMGSQRATPAPCSCARSDCAPKAIGGSRHLPRAPHLRSFARPLFQRTTRGRRTCSLTRTPPRQSPRQRPQQQRRRPLRRQRRQQQRWPRRPRRSRRQLQQQRRRRGATTLARGRSRSCGASCRSAARCADVKQGSREACVGGVSRFETRPRGNRVDCINGRLEGQGLREQPAIRRWGM